MSKLPPFRQRSRMVNFRLTEQEYDELRLNAERGGQTISDLARAAVLQHAEPELSIRMRLQVLDEKIKELSSTFCQLVSTLRNCPAVGHGSGLVTPEQTAEDES